MLEKLMFTKIKFVKEDKNEMAMNVFREKCPQKYRYFLKLFHEKRFDLKSFIF